MSKRSPRKVPPHDFSDLSELSKKMKTQAKQTAEKEKRLQEQARQTKVENNLFRRHMTGVTPLKTEPRAVLQTSKPKPAPLQHPAETSENELPSWSDESNIDALLTTEEAHSYRQSGIGPDTLQKLKRGHWKIQADLDLHGYRRDEAREAFHLFLQEAGTLNLRCVRIVHGIGYGSPDKTPVLKVRVLSWLIQSQHVLAYTQARPVDGGAGAVIVLLKSSASNQSR